MIILSPSGLFFSPKTLRQAECFPAKLTLLSIIFFTILIRFDTTIRPIKGNLKKP